MKHLRLTGLSLFISGFILFILTFFAGNYKLTGEILNATVKDDAQFKLLETGLSPLYNQEFSNSFQFVGKLNAAFREINNKQIATYEITGSEADQIVQLNETQLNAETLASVFAENDIGQYKRKVFLQYGGWLIQASFSSAEEFRTAVEKVANDIRKYAIMNDKGFSKYAIRDLDFQLTKASSFGIITRSPSMAMFIIYGLCILGGLLMIIPVYLSEPPGIKNNGIYKNPMKNRGWLGILTGSFLILFYIFLYFYPEHMTQWVIMVDPLSYFLNGDQAGRFFLYGFLYTLCVLVMGIRMILKYRHSRYHLIRTFSVMFFQLAFAFLIPEFLVRLNQPFFDFKNIWPLDYDFFFDSEIIKLVQSGSIGLFMLFWGILLAIIVVPLFTYLYGKRWYCSWVCGCGGLAETLGDPYRQLSDKSLKAWKIERWMVHGVLAFSVIMTIGVIYTYFTGSGNLLGINTYSLREIYGVWIGAGFAGVVGTGFYPLMGNRVWCRFGCPLAAYLGLIQRFKSRFRITTNGGQCISCGNCSTYCEMGIDVRWYAQRGQNIVRSSCVGCGVCASVCPRGVLKLENGSLKNRIPDPIEIGKNGLTLNS
ncbi:MAG TPA: 4Fe-4S dicluster domain-containing protein [Cyclobacteriaceae bacterium]|jgi:Pyruvate/2-oxoacid:ferredoxin oxidoreductase delta subunit